MLLVMIWTNMYSKQNKTDKKQRETKKHKNQFFTSGLSPHNTVG